MPKTITCQNGVNWFKERLLWHERTYMPKPGDIVYFNWSINENSNLYDGVAECVGIVEMTIDNKVFVIEGDSDGRCKEKTYCIGEHVIIGYATPLYSSTKIHLKQNAKTAVQSVALAIHIGLS